MVLANSELIEKVGVVLFPSISLRAPFIRPFDRAFRLLSRAALQLEIFALRHQRGVLQRSVKRPKRTPADRLNLAWLGAVWNDWQSDVCIVKASTVIGWHWKGLSPLLGLEGATR
jgi:hypothetical protein